MKEFEELIETYFNGNVSDFRTTIRSFDVDKTIDFVRWLHGEETLDTFYADSDIIRILMSALIVSRSVAVTNPHPCTLG